MAAGRHTLLAGLWLALALGLALAGPARAEDSISFEILTNIPADAAGNLPAGNPPSEEDLQAFLSTARETGLSPKPASAASPVAQFARASAQSGGPSVAPLAQMTVNPIYFWTTPLGPAGFRKTRVFTAFFVNTGDQVVNAGAVVSFWANKTEPATCGEAGADAEYTLPEMAPFKIITVRVKVPYTSNALISNATNVMRIFLDSTCQVAADSDLTDQYTTSPSVLLPKSSASYAALTAATNLPNNLPNGIAGVVYGGGFADFFTFLEMTPTVPTTGGTFKVNVPVTNFGTASSPEGVTMQVWANTPVGINLKACTNTGDKTVILPAIAPGQTKIIEVEGLVAPSTVPFFGRPRVNVVVDASCMLQAAPAARVSSYDIMATPSAVFRGYQARNQITYEISTDPKVPKAGTTMTVKFKVMNIAATEGAIGTVGVWLKPALSPSPLLWGGYYSGSRCARTGLAATAGYPKVVVQPGMTKTLTIRNVPVPAGAGWYEVSALPDINCTLPATATSATVPAFAAFEVVA